MTDATSMGAADPPAIQHNASARSFARNVLFGYLATLTSMLAGFVVTPILYRNLSVDSYAAFGLVNGIGGFALLADLGVGTSTVRRVARAVATGDEDALWATVRGARVLTMLSAAGSLVALLIIAWRMPDLFGVPAHLKHQTQVAMALVAIGVAANLALSVPTMVIIGHGRSDLLSKRALVLGLTTSVAQCAAAASGGGVVGVCSVAAVAAVATSWIGFVQQRRVWRPKARPTGSRMTDVRDIVQEGMANFVISVAGTVAFTSDTIVLGAIASFPAIAAYTVASKLPGLIRTLASRAIDLLQPTYSHFYAADADGSDGALLRVLSRATRFSCATAITLGLGVCASGHFLLHKWVGNTPAKTGEVLVLLMIGTVLQMFGHAIYVLLTGIRRLRPLLIFSVISASVNVGLSIVFTEHLGAPGPALASLVCVCVGDLFVVPAITASALGVTPWELLRELLAAPLVPLIPAAGLVVALQVSTASAWSLVVGAGAALLYLAGFWTMLGRSDRDYLAGMLGRLRRGRAQASAPVRT